uniref:(northern house mosquito) hypothetical protein n=1 Tax=Culex pipiens TaxID=7175 RepID=A0A8D8DEL9_CULPI
MNKLKLTPLLFYFRVERYCIFAQCLINSSSNQPTKSEGLRQNLKHQLLTILTRRPTSRFSLSGVKARIGHKIESNRKSNRRPPNHTNQIHFSLCVYHLQTRMTRCFCPHRRRLPVARPCHHLRHHSHRK